MKSLLVSEIFSSIQGEGLNIGTPSTFLRLTGCHLHCAWCDTAYTWRFNERFPHRSGKVYSESEEAKIMSPESVFKELYARGSSHIVITGGEPMLQFAQVAEVLALLDADTSRFWTVEFETAGTIFSAGFRAFKLPVTFAVSPKLDNSGNAIKLRYRPQVLAHFVKEGSTFKFVVCSEKDLVEIDAIVSATQIRPERVFLMAEGIEAEAVIKNTEWIIPEAIKRGYRVTTRLQVLTWGNRRGV